MKKTNPELKVGDEVVLLHMEGESLHAGLKGVVVKVSLMPGNTIQYHVNWENGSKLGLLSDTDYWKLDKKINESEEERMKILGQDLDNIRKFNTSFLYKFLKKLQECGVTNMFSASPYLYMGRKRMVLDFQYNNIESEPCDEVLDLADKSQSEIINGVIKVLEHENKEADIDIINRYAKKYSTKILTNFIALH